VRREHRVRQLEERMPAGGDWQESGLVFTTSRGTPLDAKYVTHRLQALLERIGLPRMRFHDLRDAYASFLAQGASMRELMDVLGHDRMATTSDIFPHVVEEARREVAARMELALRGSLSM
jgi:site-specific recombinase XerD